MPIGGDVWNKGKFESKDVESEIIHFLEENVGIAFTADEILQHITQFNDEPWAEFTKNMSSLIRLREILDKLTSKGKIESKIIENGKNVEQYYRFKELE